MSFGEYSLGEAPFGGEGGSSAIQPSITFEIQVTAGGNHQPRLHFEQIVYEIVQPDLVFEQIIGPPLAQPSITFEQIIFSSSQPSITFEQSIFDGASRQGRWQPFVTLDGVDISDRLTGSVSVSMEEDAAGLANFKMVPADGALDLLDYIGKRVAIKYQEIDSSGSVVMSVQMFSGIVSRPVYTPDKGTLLLHCTNDLQGRVAKMDRDQIDSIVAGKWSAHAFDEDADPWNYAQDQLSTVQASMWIDRNGLLKLSDWAAAGSPDYTFTAADRIFDTVAVNRVDKAGLKNHITATIDFRYSRQIQRNIVFRMIFQGTLCEFLEDTFKLPQRTQVQQAIDSSGWEQLGQTQFYDVWPPQVIDCTKPSDPAGSKDIRVWGLDPVLLAPQDGLDALCIGATFTLLKRWAKTITETVTLSVKAPNSITANGDLIATESYGIQAETSNETWEQDSNIYRSASDLEGDARIGGFALTMPDGSVELDNGDWCYPADDAETTGREAMLYAQETILAKMKTEILKGHRENRVNFKIPLHPMIDLSHTIRLNNSEIQATGKVASVTHTMSIESGSATSAVGLAVSDPGGVGVVVETPLAPIEATPDYALSDYEPTEWLPFTIGGRLDSPAHDPDADGYFSNYEFDPGNLDPFNANPPDQPQYPEQMVINTPEVSEGDRNAATAEEGQEYLLDIPSDELTESK